MTMVATRLEAEMGRALAGAPASHIEAALALLLELRGHDPAGALAGGTDARELARAVSDRMLDDATRWQEHLGPCFDVNGVREVLGAPGRPVSKQAVSQRRGLLALATGSGRVVYPAFQFDGHGVVAGLAEVLELLPADLVSRWTVASWLVSDDIDIGSAPISLLLAGRQRPVLEAASQWAEALSG
jgi:hypothetical protein